MALYSNNDFFAGINQTRALAMAQQQVDVTRSLINVNEEQNEIFRGIAQSLKSLPALLKTMIL